MRADGERVVGPETISAFRSWFEQVAAESGASSDGLGGGGEAVTCARRPLP